MMILTATEHATLVAALNALVPPREALPGAGDLGLAERIERAMTAEPIVRRLLLDALRAIGMMSGPETFTAQPDEAREATLRAVETAEPLAFALLVEQTYRAYYALPAVARSLGLSGEPPQPRGHHLAPFDPALLARQRDRAPFWRRTGEEQEAERGDAS